MAKPTLQDLADNLADIVHLVTDPIWEYWDRLVNWTADRWAGPSVKFMKIPVQAVTTAAPEPEPPVDTAAPSAVSGRPAELVSFWERPPIQADPFGHDPWCTIGRCDGFDNHVCRTSYGDPVRPGQSCFLSARLEAVWHQWDAS